VMQEVNESCFGAIENTLDITDVSIIKVNMEPYTVILFKLGMVMQEGKKKDMFVNRVMHREITVIIGIPDYQLCSETTLCEHMTTGHLWTVYATSL